MASVITTGGRWYETPFNPDLAQMHQHIGCETVDAVGLPNGLVMYVDDEGLLTGKQVNTLASALAGRHIVGSVIVFNGFESALDADYPTGAVTGALLALGYDFDYGFAAKVHGDGATTEVHWQDKSRVWFRCYKDSPVEVHPADGHLWWDGDQWVVGANGVAIPQTNLESAMRSSGLAGV